MDGCTDQAGINSTLMALIPKGGAEAGSGGSVVEGGSSVVDKVTACIDEQIDVHNNKHIKI